MLKMKLSFLLLFLVMHSQNALAIFFKIECDNPNWHDIYAEEPNYVEYESNGDRFSDDNAPSAYDGRFNEVFSAVVQNMLLTPVVFSRENLPRSSAFNGQVIINGRTLVYTFTVMQPSFRENRYHPDITTEYVATFTMPGTEDMYRIRGSEVPETQGEDAGEANPDEDPVEANPDQQEASPEEPTINNPENGPYTNSENEPYTNPENVTYTLHELNRSWWGRLTNPFTNLLFKPNSR